jgi:hypothetical protein
MPVVSEETRPDSRKQGRRWLLALLIPMLILLLLPVAPLFRPVTLELGGTVVAVVFTRYRPAVYTPFPRYGFGGLDLSPGSIANATVEMTPEGQQYHLERTLHVRALCFENRVYAVSWARGHRTEPDHPPRR